MAYTTIDDPSAYFHTQLYSGNSTDDRNITNDANAGDFQPDFLWIKERTDTAKHQLIDSTRGASISTLIDGSSPSAEDTDANRVQAFQTDGFQLGTASTVNASGETYVAWQWVANGGTTTSFTESGSNPGGTHQANTTAGFSIIAYTGTGSAGTFAHGMGKTPKFIIFKSRTQTERPFVPSELITGNANGGLLLDRTDAEYTLGTNNMDASQVDSTNIHVKTSGNVNTDSQNYICFAWAEIKGFSKFGTYKGNGNADGTFVYTGFKPAWVMVKRTDTAKNWYMFDNQRTPNNVIANLIAPNLNSAEDVDTGTYIDFLSNGFKLRQDFSHMNASGGTHIYMAFAESPFVSSEGIPTTAR